jgi:hypothetical protein
VNGSKDLEKHFLGEVERVITVAEQMSGQLHDHALVLGQELRVRGFLAGCTPLHEQRLAPADVRPTDCARLFQ